jgi:NAD(P)-dependent dehydrogenase (short-subunit alcohol dehydrogenase family)
MSYKSLKSDLLSRGIALASVKPGIVDTPMLRQLFPRIEPKVEKELVRPETVACFVEYLMNGRLSEEMLVANEWDIYNRVHH